jgi:Gpi18-like mannosyltransferase
MKELFRKLSFPKLLILGIVVRLILLPLSFHSDLNTNAIWGIYAEEFGLRGFYDWLNFGNYARPDYPPLAMVMFLNVRRVWEIFFNFFWGLNLRIPVFPSNFIPWFEIKGYLALLKLPGIISDIGITILIYKFIKGLKGEKVATFISSLFLFNPAVIYVSSVWGQLDSIVSFFALSSILLILKKNYAKSLFTYFVSIMTKATFVPLSILLLIKSFKEKIPFKKVLFLSLLTLSLLWLIGEMFIDKSYLAWTITTYVKKIIPGAVTLPYINLNAFNFWGLLLGLERILDSRIILGLSLNLWGWLIFVPFAILIIWKFIKGGNIFFASLTLFFSIFLFTPRVHERYFYPVIVFFPLVLYYFPKLKKYFYLVTVLFLINLYHWWWVPNLPILPILFDLEFVERLLAFLNIFAFGAILREYLGKIKWNFR